MRIRGRIAAVLVVAGAALAGAAPAHAAFSVGINGTSTLSAGAHEDVTVTLNFPDIAYDAENADLKLPPGLIGDPNAVVKCTRAQADALNCPAGSQVGTTTVTTDVWLPEVLGGLTLPDQYVPGAVYMMEPRGNEVARLITKLGPYVDGTNTMVPQGIETIIRLNSPGDYSLVTEMRTLPQTSQIYALGWFLTTGYIQLKSMRMVLWGVRDHMLKPFMTNPTDCGAQLRYKASAKRYGSNNWVDGQSTPITLTDCAAPAFTPAASVSPAEVTADAPTGVSVTMGFPAPGPGRGQSTVKSTEFVLPEGFGLSATSGSAGDLAACSDAVFAKSVASEPACPAGSVIGSVNFQSPLIEGAITGKIYIGDPLPGVPLRTLIHASQGPLHIKLVSQSVPDPVTGQIRTTFADVPPVPFTSFTMSFRGGDHAILKAPSVCGRHTATARVEPAARPGTFALADATVNVSGCLTAQFAPTMSASVSSNVAGADTAMSMTFGRSDADERLGSTAVSMPAGLLGRLTAVPLCSLALARTGDCPEASRVGTVTSVAGTGPAPLPLSGPVYLTEAEPGAVAGLAIVVPAEVGPIKLGKVAVLARMTVRPDMGIDVTTGDIPQIAGGVPLFLRSMTLTLDRAGFMFNASSCAPAQISARITSIAGSVSTLAAPYQPVGCESLPFAPGFSAKLGGKDLASPSLSTTMTPRAGDASMSSMSMTLPPTLGASLKAVSNTCPQADFDARRCADKAVVGSAKAISPLVPDPLSGPVYLVKLNGQVLPGLIADLHGAVDMPITIVNSVVKGRLTSNVTGVPDVPLTRFDLDLKAGALLEGDKAKLCKSPQKMSMAFTAHSGARSTSTPPLTVDCSVPPRNARATGSVRASKRRTELKLTIRTRKGAAAAKRIRSVKVTLPKSLRLVRSRVARRTRVTARGAYLRQASVKARGRSISASLPADMRRDGVTSLSMRVGNGALKARGKRRRSVTVKILVTHADSSRTRLSVKLRVRR